MFAYKPPSGCNSPDALNASASSFFQSVTLSSKGLQDYCNMFSSAQTANHPRKPGSFSPTQGYASAEFPKQSQQNVGPLHHRAPSFSFMRRTRSNEQSQDQPIVQAEQEVPPAPERERVKAPRIPSFHMLAQTEVPLFDVNAVPSDSHFPVHLRDHPANRSPAPSSASSFYESPILKQNLYHQRDLSNSPFQGTMGSPSLASHEFTSPDASPRPDTATNGSTFNYQSPNLSGPNANRRLRRKKDPVAFNILVLGTKNSGKTSFIEFILSSLAKPIKQRANTPPPRVANKSAIQFGAFTPHYLETEIESERVGITMYDSKGLEGSVVDLQLREITSFVESKFQETFSEEQKVLRSNVAKDTHIHCVILLLDPGRLDANNAMSGSSLNATRGVGINGKTRIIGSLDEELDIDVLRLLNSKTTVIPIISKADTITSAHMTFLKRSVSDTIKKLGFDPYEALNHDSDNESDDESDGHSTIRDMTNDDTAKDGDYEASIIVDHTQIIETVDKTVEEPKAPTPEPTKSPEPSVHNEARLSQISVVAETPFLPMSILSPDIYDPGTIGRRFPWGFADPYQTDHCDFVLLKDSLFGEWRDDLRQASSEKWYEGWRTSRLRRANTTIPPSPSIGYGAEPKTNASSSVKGGQGLGLSSINDFQQRNMSSSQNSIVSGSASMVSAEQKSLMSDITVT